MHITRKSLGEGSGGGRIIREVLPREITHGLRAEEVVTQSGMRPSLCPLEVYSRPCGKTGMVPLNKVRQHGYSAWREDEVMIG